MLFYIIKEYNLKIFKENKEKNFLDNFNLQSEKRKNYDFINIYYMRTFRTIWGKDLLN